MIYALLCTLNRVFCEQKKSGFYVTDDCNIPIEIPLLVQTLSDQHLDIVPEFKIDQVTETQLIITQRTFDCEQFIQTKGQKLCADSQLEYRFCEDYEVNVKHVSFVIYIYSSFYI